MIVQSGSWHFSFQVQAQILVKEINGIMKGTDKGGGYNRAISKEGLRFLATPFIQ
jgi:hypothetical protein